MDSNVGSTTNDSNNVETNAKNPTVYYGVHIPLNTDNGETNVFEDKESALKLAKKNKKSRFKSFQFYHEAVEFSINGSEYPNNNSFVDGSDTGKKESASAVGEKGSPFRCPRPQELVEFRNAIVHGDLDRVKKMVEVENPRYLVSSGDTPSILQEGARLNALHIAAKAKHAHIAEYILNTINDPEFIKKLYGDDNQENAEQRCKMLLDLYLNLPNKGFNDTPLHVAVKWGADKVVETLLYYPECDRMKRNTHNKLPEDVICERVDAKTPVTVKKKIQQLLCSNYYVPVLRTEDNTFPPVVGEPFSPTSPPVLNKDPLSPRLEIHAYAGPMDKRDAESFRRVWKTPPRSLNFNSPNGKKTPNVEDLTAIRLKDPEKGLERIGKKLANNYNVSWKEYWEFLDSFVDIASEEGLDMLEDHLKQKHQEIQKMQRSFENLSPPEPKAEPVVSPITSLCNAFSACKIEDSHSEFFNDWKSPVDSQETCRPLVYVDKACQVFANRILGNVSTILRCSEREYENTANILETDIKPLELVINSYMDDDRFTEWVNFQKVHSRLAYLIAKKLRECYKDCEDNFLINRFEVVLESIVKRSDYFSSDDEAPNTKDSSNKPTSYRKQAVCLLSRIKTTLESPPNLSDFDEDHLTVNGWQAFSVCNCVFHPRKPRRTNLSRSGSLKNHSNKRQKLDLQNVSKKLTFGDELLSCNSLIGYNGDLGISLSSDSSKSTSDDEFYTPPSSPSRIGSEDISDSEDQFSDAEPPMVEVFLEGSFPTKTDSAVFSALSYADCDIDRMKYPTVFQWHHTVNLYTESERERWPSQHTPEKEATYIPIKPSWWRVTGTNSPRATIRSHSSRESRNRKDYYENEDLTIFPF